MSNLDSLVLEPIEQPLSNTPNMLSNEDRVLCNMTPLQRLYIDDDNAVVSKYRKHLDRARISFYESEEVKIASRKSTAPDSDEFNDLVTSIERYIGNELDDDYPDGFTKVKSVEKKAGTYNMPTSMLISHLVDSNVCVGVCHQLSNENRIKWTVNE